MALRILLQQQAMKLAVDYQVKDVRIGLCYVAVQLNSGATGLAYIFLDSVSGGCSAYDKLVPLAGRPARDLLKLFDCEDNIASAIALATANALFNTLDQPYSEGPALEQLQLNPSDRVGMIGHFAPLVNNIKQRAGKLEIFERQARAEDNILGIEQAVTRLPQCQVAIISSTTIINNSIDELLTLTRNCREVVLVGSSTPLIGQVFNGTPVTLLSGILIDDSHGILQRVSEGGGTPAFKPCVSKVNIQLAHSSS